MPLETLEASAPPFFRQGPSALSKLIFLGALSVLLMVADARFRMAQPLRATLATALAPLQWVLLQPLHALQGASNYTGSLNQARTAQAAAAFKLGQQSQRAQQVEQLSLENARLRALLGLRERLNAPARAAQVLYDAADAYSRKVIIDQGSLAGVQAGAPVLDESGVLGQVTRVYPLVSEVSLLVDGNQAIPVLAVRNGVRGVAWGNGQALELRFMDRHVDLEPGDLLTTSGVDGVYPPGLAVARVQAVQRQTPTAFAQIDLQPLAAWAANLHVLVLAPLGPQVLPRPPQGPQP